MDPEYIFQQNMEFCILRNTFGGSATLNSVLPCDNIKKYIEKGRLFDFSNMGWLTFRENDPGTLRLFRFLDIRLCVRWGDQIQTY